MLFRFSSRHDTLRSRRILINVKISYLLSGHYVFKLVSSKLNCFYSRGIADNVVAASRRRGFTKVQAGTHPRLRETDRCKLYFFSSLNNFKTALVWIINECNDI